MPLFALMPHIAAGLLVLALYWMTILARKGGNVHRRNGRRYLILLAPLLASVVPISLHYVAGDPARLVQLLYLSLVVTAAGWTAWRAVKDRAHPERFRGPVFRTIAVLLTCSAAVLFVIGIAKLNVLNTGFAIMGIVYGGAMLGHLGRPPAPGWWLDWHLNGVCLLFAATHASFLGLAARTAFPDLAGPVLVAATQLGTIAVAFGLRQVLGWRFAGLAAPVPALSALSADSLPTAARRTAG